ncbi:MAG: type II secretion system F family protein [Nanoarchaeota archaeon]|nr:type II secretion system F family protein [Nanoarchaeota archaeon]
MSTWLENLGKSIIPEKFRVNIKSYMYKTGRSDVPYRNYGILFIICMLGTIVAYSLLLFPLLRTQHMLVLIFGSFIALSGVSFAIIAIAIFSVYVYYEFVIFRRTMMIEEVLPDFLEEVSVNLRAGMSFDKALWNSLEPEFGVLEKEIQIVAKKVMAGDDTEKALKEFSEKYNSLLLQESMDMIVVGLKSGGNISELIEKIVKNVKDAYYLKKELIASVMSYIIFISVTAIIISPILFALSYNLMIIIQSLGEKLTTSSSGGILPSIGGFSSISPADFVLFSKFSVILIASIASIIIAELREGSVKAGIKYLFLYIPVAYLVYIVMLGLLSTMFGVMIV